MERSDQFGLGILAGILVAGCSAVLPAARSADPSDGDVVGRDELAGYELASTTQMSLEATSPIAFRQERDRCYAVVMRVEDGELSNRVRRDGVTVGPGGVGEGEHVTMSARGGVAQFCPLVASKKPLQIYYVMPSDRRLGQGTLNVEVWSKRMPAEWVRKELHERRVADRYLATQPDGKLSAACEACADRYDTCREQSRSANSDDHCWRTVNRCYSANHCL